MISRYQSIKIIKSSNNKQIYNQVYYPIFGEDIDSYYIITSYSDRYDTIALDFWNDESLWFLIPLINKLDCDTMYPPVGIQISIPKKYQDLLNQYIKENEI